MSSPVTPKFTRQLTPPPTRGTALVADDEPVVLQLCELMFRQLGFTVLPAHDGRQAVELFSQHHEVIRIVILDWSMPDVGGEEALSVIRSTSRLVPVILCSGHSEETLPDKVRVDPHTRFLGKPFSMRTLKDLVNQSVGTAL